MIREVLLCLGFATIAVLALALLILWGYNGYLWIKDFVMGEDIW